MILNLQPISDALEDTFGFFSKQGSITNEAWKYPSRHCRRWWMWPASSVSYVCQLGNKNWGCLTNLHTLTEKLISACPISKFVLFALTLQGSLISRMTWADLIYGSAHGCWRKHLSKSAVTTPTLILPIWSWQSVPYAHFCLSRALSL